MVTTPMTIADPIRIIIAVKIAMTLAATICIKTGAKTVSFPNMKFLVTTEGEPNTFSVSFRTILNFTQSLPNSSTFFIVVLSFPFLAS